MLKNVNFPVFFLPQLEFYPAIYMFGTNLGHVTRYSSRIAPLNDVLVRLANFKAYENKPYSILMTLYGPTNHQEKVAFI